MPIQLTWPVWSLYMPGTHSPHVAVSALVCFSGPNFPGASIADAVGVLVRSGSVPAGDTVLAFGAVLVHACGARARACVCLPGTARGVEGGVVLPRVGDLAFVARGEGRGGVEGVEHVGHLGDVPRVYAGPGEFGRAVERVLQRDDLPHLPPG